MLFSRVQLDDIHPAEMIIDTKIDLIDAVDKLKPPIKDEENPDVVLEPDKQDIIFLDSRAFAV